MSSEIHPSGSGATTLRAPVRGPASGGRGQATVELALGLPVVFLALTLLLQFAFVGRDLLLVHHAAREGARAEAVGRGAADDGARNASTALDPRRLGVRATDRGDRVEVLVEYDSVTAFPLVGPLLPDIRLHASATAVTETGR